MMVIGSVYSRCRDGLNLLCLVLQLFNRGKYCQRVNLSASLSLCQSLGTFAERFPVLVLSLLLTVEKPGKDTGFAAGSLYYTMEEEHIPGDNPALCIEHHGHASHGTITLQVDHNELATSIWEKLRAGINDYDNIRKSVIVSDKSRWRLVQSENKR